MLTLIEDRKSKETEQSRLEDNLKAALTCRGNLKIGFRPKTVEIPVYSFNYDALQFYNSIGYGEYVRRIRKKI